MTISNHTKKLAVSRTSIIQKKHLRHIITTLLCLSLVLSLCGCNKNVEVSITKENGTTCANIVMSMGRFAYKNGLLYFADPSTIYEYDIETGKTVFLPVKIPGDPMDLLITENHIVYTGFSGDIKRRAMTITKDGKTTEELFEVSKGCHRLYTDGDDAYYLSSSGGNLYYRNITDGKEELILEDALTYFATADRIYAIQLVDEKYVLKACARNDFTFEIIPLSFEPIEILVDGQDIYLSQKGDYQVVRYCNGDETILPIRSMKYQLDNDCLLYSDEDTFENSTWTIKSFDLKTQETTVICEDVMEFGVFDEGYIAFWCRGTSGSWWKLYDEQTDSLRQIYPAA